MPIKDADRVGVSDPIYELRSRLGSEGKTPDQIAEAIQAGHRLVRLYMCGRPIKILALGHSEL